MINQLFNLTLAKIFEKKILIKCYNQPKPFAIGVYFYPVLRAFAPKTNLEHKYNNGNNDGTIQ